MSSAKEFVAETDLLIRNELLSILSFIVLKHFASFAALVLD